MTNASDAAQGANSGHTDISPDPYDGGCPADVITPAIRRAEARLATDGLDLSAADAGVAAADMAAGLGRSAAEAGTDRLAAAIASEHPAVLVRWELRQQTGNETYRDIRTDDGQEILTVWSYGDSTRAQVLADYIVAAHHAMLAARKGDTP